MQHFMCRPFGRMNEFTFTFTSDFNSNFFPGVGGLNQTGPDAGPLGSIAPWQHWNGLKLIDFCGSDAGFGEPTGNHYYRVRFQHPAFQDVPGGIGQAARELKFGKMVLDEGTFLESVLTLADARVIRVVSTASHGDVIEIMFPGTQLFGGVHTLKVSDLGLGSAFTPPASYAIGVNLSGMEWGAPGVRFGTSTYPNINYTVPRASDLAYLASQGVTLVRLPITWEYLQPLLATSVASAATQAAFNTTSPAQVYAKGDFWEVYAQAIDKVLDAAQAAGIKVILDLHNYCRYKDFVYDGAGNVVGLTNPADDVTPPYTTDNTKVTTRIFANAATSPTLTQANFNDFWTKAATRWKNHAALGGYSLMNEPHDMPTATTNTAWNDPFIAGNAQDYSIWTSYAQAAVNAIRAVDANTKIYVGGNDYQNPMNWSTINPGFPLAGTGLIYDFHLYLDATSGGFRFDWDEEVAKGFSAGEGSNVINTQTGTNRTNFITTWAAANGNPTLACTEFGLPVEDRTSTPGVQDQRWIDAGVATISTLFNNNIQVFAWMGGNHWPLHGYPINATPRWHQNKTVLSQVTGYMQERVATEYKSLFDEGPAYVAGATPITITVWNRGHLTGPILVNVTCDTGTLSKAQLTLGIGANTLDTFTYTPVAETIGTITYTVVGAVTTPPPARKVYCFADPAITASLSVTDKALAVIAKYSAALWRAQDAYKDYLYAPGTEVAAAVGDEVRAIADAGGSSGIENPWEAVNWFNNEAPTSIRGTEKPPILANDPAGFKALDWTAGNNTRRGLLSKHLAPVDNPTATNPTLDNYPHPTAEAMFNLTDNHFGVLVFKSSNAAGSGPLMVAQEIMGPQRSALQLNAGKVELQQLDKNSITATLTDTVAQAVNTVCVASFVSTATAQKLRVNSVEVATGAHAWATASDFSTMTLGYGYWDFFPRQAAEHYGHAWVFGKGAPRTDEMSAIEAYLKTLAFTPPTLQPWEQTVFSLFNGGNAGWWGASRSFNEFYTDGVGSTHPVAWTDLIGRVINHGNTANGHDLVQTDNANRWSLGTDGVTGAHRFGCYNGAPIISAGQSTTQFYFCAAIEIINPSYDCVILSDSDAANVGIQIEQEAFAAVIILKVGTGAATVTVQASYPAGSNNPAGKIMLEAWHDGTNIQVQVNGVDPGAGGKSACAAISPGNANLLFLGDYPLTGSATTNSTTANVFESVYFKDFCPDATNRDSIRAGIKAQAQF